MKTRVSTKVVVFSRPFVLNRNEDVQPAGAYTVETEEELLDSILTPAYRRVSTIIYCYAGPGTTRYVTVNPAELDAALARDARPID